MKRIMRIVTILTLLLALLVTGWAAAESAVPTAGETTLSIRRGYELASTEVGIYREGSCSTLWGMLPAGTVIQVERLSTGFATITLNGLVGYIDTAATRRLEPGDILYTNRPTRVYPRSNTACNYIEVPKGMDVTFVAMAGTCVQVTRNGITGYMYIGHLSGSR